MKTLRFFTLFLLLVTMTLSTSSVSLAAAPAKNLVPNPSFEKAAKGKVLPEGWIGGSVYATQSWVKGVAYSGKSSVCISNVVTSHAGIWGTADLVPTTAGKSYTASVYVKGDLSNGIYYIFQSSVDANGNTLGYSFQPTANFNNSTWTYYEIVFTVPEGAIGTHIALTAVNLGLDTSTGTICFDDVSVKEIP